MYRVRSDEVEYLLVHPGGPLWQNKDAGIWSIPKGEIHPGEDGLAAAKREFEEELGVPQSERPAAGVRARGPAMLRCQSKRRGSRLR